MQVGAEKRIGIKSEAEYYDRLADQYDNVFSEPIYQAEDQAVIVLIRDHLKGKVLDIGCGTGLLLEHLSIDQYVGVDISQGMVENARLKYPTKQFKVGEMHKFLSAQPNGSADTIVSLYGTFSYSSAPKNFLKNCNRVLKNGGKAIFMPLTKRTGEKIYIGKTTSSSTNLFYDSEQLNELFGQTFSSHQLIGLNYFGGLMAEMTERFGKVLEIDKLSEFLIHEARTVALPVEYARHSIVIASK